MSFYVLRVHIMQLYRTLAEWEFGWGGTSVRMQHRCPKGSSV